MGSGDGLIEQNVFAARDTEGDSTGRYCAEAQVEPTVAWHVDVDGERLGRAGNDGLVEDIRQPLPTHARRDRRAVLGLGDEPNPLNLELRAGDVHWPDQERGRLAHARGGRGNNREALEVFSRLKRARERPEEDPAPPDGRVDVGFGVGRTCCTGIGALVGTNAYLQCVDTVVRIKTFRPGCVDHREVRRGAPDELAVDDAQL